MQKNNNLKIPGFVTSIIFSLCLSIAMSIVLSLIASFILLKQSDPLSLITPVSLCILYFSSFAAPFICSKFTQSTVICGLISGLVMVIVMLTASGLVNTIYVFSPVITTILFAIVPCLTTLGSLLGKADYMKKNSNNTKRKKLHKKYSSPSRR